MGKKSSGKKAGKGKKVLFGVLFIVACFAAAYVLIEFHSDMLIVGVTAVVLMLSAFLFMNAVFAEKAKNWVPEDLDGEKELSGTGDSAEFQLKMTKQMKELVSVQKDMLAAVKQQSTMLQGQIENLEQEIYMLSEKQMVQTKTVIKYSKENARQQAISERETLEHILYEIKQAMEDNISQITIQNVVAGETTEEPAAPAAEQEPVFAPEMAGLMADTAVTEEPVQNESILMDSLEEVSESELFAVEEFPDDDEYEEPDLMALLDSLENASTEDAMPADTGLADIEIPDIQVPDMEISDIGLDEAEIPDVPADIIIPELEGLLGDVSAMEEPMAEMSVIEELKVEEKVEEPAPAPAPVPVASDPNAMMTPEDIAKLLESMGV